MVVFCCLFFFEIITLEMCDWHNDICIMYIKHLLFFFKQHFRKHEIRGNYLNLFWSFFSLWIIFILFAKLKVTQIHTNPIAKWNDMWISVFVYVYWSYFIFCLNSTLILMIWNAKNMRLIRQLTIKAKIVPTKKWYDRLK